MSESLQSREFSVDVAMDLETVWAALTTGEGLSSWYAIEATVDPAPGGKFSLDWGDGNTYTAVIDAIEPPRRLRLVYEAPDGGPSGAEEWFLSHDEGVTHVRLIHSLPVEDGATWDDTYPGIVRGWGLFLGTLHWIGDHVGELGRNARARIGPYRDGGWQRVLQALGLAEAPVAGASVGLGARAGEVIESVDGYSLLFAIDDGATLLIDVEGDKLYTVSATYRADDSLLDDLVTVAERLIAAAGSS